MVVLSKESCECIFLNKINALVAIFLVHKLSSATDFSEQRHPMLSREWPGCRCIGCVKFRIFRIISTSVQGFQHSTSKNYFAVCPERYATLKCPWLEETAWRKNVFRSSFEHLPNFGSAQISSMTWYNDMGSHAALQRRDQHF